MKQTGERSLFSGFVILMLLMAIGCQTQNINSFYIGNQVNPDDSRPLVTGESRSGQWQTSDMLVNYQYRMENNSLKISGDTTLSDYYQINLRSLRDLELFLFFLDGQHKVLETVQLFKSLSTSLEDTHSFKKTLSAPSAATAISFGYRGAAREGRRTGFQRFDHLPKNSQ